MRLIDADALKDELIECTPYAIDPVYRNTNSNIDMFTLMEMLDELPAADVVPVVRCGECIWWQDRQVQLIDGSCRDYMPDEPWSVTCDVGINVGSHCTKHGFDDESGSWFWAAANDYCSRGEREGTMTK